MKAEKINSHDDYLTIAEFARLVGITPAGVYKRIKDDSELSTFVKTVNNKKCINRTASELFHSTCYQPVVNQLIASYQLNIDILTKEVEARDHQLEKKDEQINGYIIQIAELNEHLRNQTKLVQESHYIVATGQKQIEDVPGLTKKRSFWDRFKRKGVEEK